MGSWVYVNDTDRELLWTLRGGRRNTFPAISSIVFMLRIVFPDGLTARNFNIFCYHAEAEVQTPPLKYSAHLLKTFPNARSAVFSSDHHLSTSAFSKSILGTIPYESGVLVKTHDPNHRLAQFLRSILAPCRKGFKARIPSGIQCLNSFSSIKFSYTSHSVTVSSHCVTVPSQSVTVGFGGLGVFSGSFFS